MFDIRVMLIRQSHYELPGAIKFNPEGVILFCQSLSKNSGFLRKIKK
jgi:hypothetical protein